MWRRIAGSYKPTPTLGDRTPAARNLISGNDNLGVVLVGAGTSHNLVQGNFIGTDVTGTASLGNANSVVRLIGGTHHNTIGGNAPGTGNLISGNENLGVGLHNQQTSRQLSVLHEIDIAFADLDSMYLGMTTGSKITFDTHAAGYGWFIDPTPLDDLEFYDPRSAAMDRMDLLSAVMHEMGHVLGLEDLTGDSLTEDIMFARLNPGQRRGPHPVQ